MKLGHPNFATLLSALALLLPPAAASAAGAMGGTVKAAGILKIDGECQILTDGNGHKLALVGKLGALASGDQISVTGKEIQQTRCLKGPTIQVEKSEKLAPAAGKTAGEPAKGTPELEIVTEPGKGGVPEGKGGAQLRMFHMRGTLTAEGKKCQGFRNLRGDLYVLTGDLKGFKTGDKVELEGAGVEKSDCGQPTVQITTIQALK
jgi:hypothetical protein